MDRTRELAQLLISSWVLVEGTGDNKQIPSWQGVLDRALNNLVKNRALPEWAISSLHFVDSRIGLKCVELPSILSLAQSSGLVTAPNPSYRSTQIQISPEAAMYFIDKLEVTEDAARSLGKVFQEEVHSAEKLLESYDPAGMAESNNC
jgi:hypothetical protein